MCDCGAIDCPACYPGLQEKITCKVCLVESKLLYADDWSEDNDICADCLKTGYILCPACGCYEIADLGEKVCRTCRGKGIGECEYCGDYAELTFGQICAECFRIELGEALL